MLLNLREYQRPGEGAPAGHQRERLEQALALLARPHVRSVALAGGNSLLGSTDSNVQAVVDLQGLGLDDLATENDHLRIGAMVTRAAPGRSLQRARAGQLQWPGAVARRRRPPLGRQCTTPSRHGRWRGGHGCGQ